MTTLTRSRARPPVLEGVTGEPTPEPARWKTLAAFAAIYVIWGSTYLAIRYAVDTIPPFLLTGVRCLIAGALLYAWARHRGATRPGARAWAAALTVGVLLFVVGQGLVGWAETRVSSGPAALMIATVPLWMVLLAWGRRAGPAPSGRIWLGLAAGLVGVALLVGPGGDASVDPAGALALLLAAASWAAGSQWARGAALPSSRAQSAGMQLLAAGAVLGGLSLALGEPVGFALTGVSGASLAALAYLIGFGSVVGFSAYLWLLDHHAPARVGSHAYVNPLVAVLLGTLAGDVVLSGWVVLATCAVIAAVALTMEEA